MTKSLNVGIVQCMKAIEILFVDDEQADIDLTLKMMHKSKVANHVHALNSGQEALDFLEKKAPFEEAPKPDLILLDIKMPGMSGQEVLKYIKEHPEFKRIPVVILTSSDSDKDILLSYSLHANAYINKPVGIKEIEKIVGVLEDFWLSIVKLPPK